MTPAGREVIFVGGTRFSGSDAVATRLAEDSGMTAPPLAVGFHSDPWGIPALLHGRIGVDDFAQRVRSQPIAERVQRQRLDAWLGALTAGFHADPLQACRDLFWATIDELAPASGDGPLVDASPGNLAEAHTLTRLVPGARFVHVVRDGRDVAASAVESDAMPVHRMTAGLAWWAGELRVIERGVRGEEDGAAYAVPEERLDVVVRDEPADSWRDQARGPARWWTTRRYERTLRDLHDEGNHAAPALRAAYEGRG